MMYKQCTSPRGTPWLTFSPHFTRSTELLQELFKYYKTLTIDWMSCLAFCRFCLISLMSFWMSATSVWYCRSCRTTLSTICKMSCIFPSSFSWSLPMATSWAWRLFSASAGGMMKTYNQSTEVKTYLSNCTYYAYRFRGLFIYLRFVQHRLNYSYFKPPKSLSTEPLTWQWWFSNKAWSRISILRTHDKISRPQMKYIMRYQSHSLELCNLRPWLNTLRDHHFKYMASSSFFQQVQVETDIRFENSLKITWITVYLCHNTSDVSTF